MADLKISQLTAASTPLAGTEVLPIVQSSTTKKVAVSDLTAGRAVSAAQLDVDNIRLDANTVSTTNTNGNLTVAPNGSGQLVVDKNSVSAVIRARGLSSRETNAVVAGYQDDANAGKAAFGVNAYPDTQYSTALTRLRGDMNAWALYGESSINTFESLMTFKLFHVAAGGTQTAFWTVDAAGNFTVNAGNVVVGTAGKGIDFSAAANAAGMTSELLSDYEEGTWTPTVTGATTAGTATYQTQTGYYTRIGRQVFCHINLYWLTSTGTGTALVGGLPFTVNSSLLENFAILFDGNANVTNASASKIEQNTTRIRAYQYSVGGAGTIFGQFSYFV